MRGFLAAVVVLAAFVVAVAPAGAVTPPIGDTGSLACANCDGGSAPVGCSSVGQTTYDGGSGSWAFAGASWCWSYGTITAYSPWRDFGQCGCYWGWGWAGWSDTRQSGGVGYGSATYWAQGWFQEWHWIPIYGMTKFHDSFPAASITVNGWGGYS